MPKEFGADDPSKHTFSDSNPRNDMSSEYPLQPQAVENTLFVRELENDLQVLDGRSEIKRVLLDAGPGNFKIFKEYLAKHGKQLSDLANLRSKPYELNEAQSCIRKFFQSAYPQEKTRCIQQLVEVLR